MRALPLVLAVLLAPVTAHGATLYLFGSPVHISPDRPAVAVTPQAVVAPPPAPAPVAAPADGEEDLEALLDRAGEDLEDRAGSPFTVALAPRPAAAPRDESRASQPFFTWVGEDVTVETAGLTRRQVDGTLEELLPTVRACVPDRSRVAGALEVWLTVDPTGRVSRLESASSTLPADVEACAARVLQGAAFPAHGQAEGFRFGYVVRVGS